MKRTYLVQHGKGFSESENAARPLTEKGKQEVLQVAASVAKLKLGVSTIYHSGKLRAKETAELFAKCLGLGSVKEIHCMAPLDSPEIAKNLIEETDLPIMLVGHLPHLSRLVSALVGTEREVVKFQMEGVIALEKGEPGWHVIWMLMPEFLPIIHM